MFLEHVTVNRSISVIIFKICLNRDSAKCSYHARISRPLVGLQGLQRSQSSSDDIMESTADNGAIKEMLQQWAGEDTEIVFEKLRKLQSIEKVYRGITSTDRIHDVPRSYGKLAGLATNQKLKICKL